jgi:hypothetical protein
VILASVSGLLVILIVVLAFTFFRQYNVRKEREEAMRAERERAATMPASQPAPVLGSIDAVAFKASVEEANKKLQNCATQAIKEQLTEPVVFKIDARIDLEGKPSNVVVSDPLKNAEVSKCIAREVEAHTFVKAQKAPVDIGFSLTFEPPAKKGAAGKAK